MLHIIFYISASLVFFLFWFIDFGQEFTLIQVTALISTFGKDPGDVCDVAHMQLQP